MSTIPQVTQELVEYLEGICPDSSPSLDTPDRNIWFNAGKVSVVKHLRSLFDEQNQTILKGE